MLDLEVLYDGGRSKKFLEIIWICSLKAIVMLISLRLIRNVLDLYEECELKFFFHIIIFIVIHCEVNQVPS